MGASDKLSTPLDCLLCLFVFILCHNRLMRIFADIPFFFGYAPLVFVTDESAFAGSSVIYSLIETAKENGLNPYRYLLWVLQNARG